MELVRIYACLCDRTRLRMLHLLLEGPLCVCHFQGVLREPQVKISKHLGYLKRHGMVEFERCANWRVYRLPQRRSSQLQANLGCLQDCVREDRVFREDRERLKTLRRNLGPDCPSCVRHPPAALTSKQAR